MRKRIFICILVTAMIFNLSGCGTSEQNNNLKGENKKVNYYEKCNKLPDASDVIDYNYKSESTTVTGSSAGTTEINYDVNEPSAEIDKYLKYLDKNHIEYKEEAGIYQVIIDETIAAKITTEGKTITVTILPENKRVSSVVEKIAIGQTVETDDYRIVLKNVKLTYDILPADTSSYYNHYPAPSGKVYIDVVLELKNLMQRNINDDDMPEITAIYMDKYNYTGFIAAEDGSSFDTYGDLATPLASIIVHGIIECPKEVDTSTDSLVIKILLSDGKTYEFKLR